MATGRLKYWHQDKGFGFLKQDDGSHDLFMHITSLLGSGIDPDELTVGDRLSFDIGRGRDGRSAATNVRRAS